jgi:hypothetical protein
MSRCEVAYEESYFYLNKNLWAPLTFAYATLWQKVAILTFRNDSFNFATAISKFDTFYYHIVRKRIAKVTDDLVMRRPHGLRSRPSHSSLHRSILRRSMTTPCGLSLHLSSVRHFFLQRSRATSRRYTGRRNIPRAPSSSVEVPPTHPNQLPGGLSTPTSTILALATSPCRSVVSSPTPAPTTPHTPSLHPFTFASVSWLWMYMDLRSPEAQL